MRPPAFLDGEALTLAFLWRLWRADGFVLALTSHDRPIWADGILHRARPGMTPSAISLEDGFRADSMEITGALSADAMRAEDLESGRWQGAIVELRLCDWTDPSAGSVGLARGRIGDVIRRERGGQGVFSVELLSEMAALSRGGPPRLTPMCRATLGDGRCQVDMDGRRAVALAVSVAEDGVRLADALTDPGRFSHGTLRFLDGPHAGLDRTVAAVEGDWVRVSETVPPLGSGAFRVRLTEGCDRRFETCAGRFGNALQFDGEPHVPGTDALVRYGSD